MRALILCLFLPLPAAATELSDLLGGQFGSVRDPALACDSNPHWLGAIDRPPHLVLDWMVPPPDGRVRRVYDYLGPKGDGFVLRDEAEGTLWVLRPTSDPEGYCWGRSDGPAASCENPQIRCDALPPTS